MASKEKFIVILIVLLVVLLLGGGILGWVYWKNSDQKAETVNQNTNNQVDNNTNKNTAIEVLNVNEQTTETTVVENTSPQDPQEFLTQLARNFAERYGSFSNQNDFENILDLKLYMTKKMQEDADKFIKENKDKNEANQEYYGITTKVLTLSEITYDPDGGKAIYEVGTQRKESQGASGESRTFKQSCLIEFKEVDGEWKVQQFTWK